MVHKFTEWRAYLVLVGLEKGEKLRQRAGELLVATFRLRHSTDKDSMKHIRKHRYDL